LVFNPRGGEKKNTPEGEIVLRKGKVTQRGRSWGVPRKKSSQAKKFVRKTHHCVRKWVLRITCRVNG